MWCFSIWLLLSIIWFAQSEPITSPLKLNLVIFSKGCCGTLYNRSNNPFRIDSGDEPGKSFYLMATWSLLSNTVSLM